MDASIKTPSERICIGDLGKIYCAEASVVSKLKTIPIYHFKEADHNRCVIGVLKVIELIHEQYPAFTVDVIGETECVVDRISKKKSPPFWEWIKVAFIVNVLIYAVYFIGIYDLVSCATQVITAIIGFVSLFKLIKDEKKIN